MKFVEQNNNERHTANAEDHDDSVDDGLPDGRRGVGGGVFEDHVDTRGSWKRELNTSCPPGGIPRIQMAEPGTPGD